MRRLAIVLALVAAACGNKSSSTTTTPENTDPGDTDPGDTDPGDQTGGRCAAGEMFQPGCDDNALPAAGCYVRCDDGTPCPSETTCQTVSVMPACAMGMSENEDVGCAACGEQIQLCLGD